MRASLKLVLLEVSVPRDVVRQEEQSKNLQEQLGSALQFLRSLASLAQEDWRRKLKGEGISWTFELAVHPEGEIVFYLAVPRQLRSYFEEQIAAAYPRAEIKRVPDYTIFESGRVVRAARLQLRRPAYLPCKDYRLHTADPLLALLAALSKVRRGDGAIFQLVVQPAGVGERRRGLAAVRAVAEGRERSVVKAGEWGHRMGRWLGEFWQVAAGRTQKEGMAEKPPPRLPPAEEELMKRVEEKAGEHQYYVSGRVVVASRDVSEAAAQLAAIKDALAVYNDVRLNGIILRETSNPQFFRNLIFRLPSRMYRMVLGESELVSLFHLPLPGTDIPRLRWRRSRQVAAPEELPRTGMLYLGENVFRGERRPVYLARDDRRRHVYVLGQTGTGKTTLFMNMIVQDIQQGEGVGVIDPHGDLAETLLRHIPSERMDDVIYFDPRDTARPLGLNMLEASTPAQKDLVVQEAILIIEKLATRLNPEAIGPMFEHYLRNALLALIDDPQATLVDVPRLFTDENFRAFIVRRVRDPVVRNFWEQEYPQARQGQQAADMLSYVISKLGRFIGNETIRHIIGQPRSAFDFRKVIDEGKILLANLSKGSLGDISSDLLGFILVSRLQIAAMGRSDLPEEKRRDFYLYLDEFQNFTTDTIATILSEARKYRLNLNLTHQFVSQLEEKIRNAVIGNVGTIIVFRIGADDVELMEKQFAPVFESYDLLNLERFTAYIKMLVRNQPLRPFSLVTPKPLPPGSEQRAEQLRNMSRSRYGKPRAAVARMVEERMAMQRGGDSSAAEPESWEGEFK